jgi:hypothetical protein
MIFGSMLIERKILKDGWNKENKFIKKDKSIEEVEYPEWIHLPTLYDSHLNFVSYYQLSISLKFFLCFLFIFLSK